MIVLVSGSFAPPAYPLLDDDIGSSAKEPSSGSFRLGLIQNFYRLQALDRARSPRDGRLEDRGESDVGESVGELVDVATTNGLGIWDAKAASLLQGEVLVVGCGEGAF
jgi:hypothetical protein